MNQKEKVRAAMDQIDQSITERQPHEPPKPAGNNSPSVHPRNAVDSRVQANLPVTAPTIDQYITNIDLTTWRGKAMLANAASPGDMDFGQAREVRLTATSFAVFPDSGINPETGEVSEFSRTVFFDAEGRTFRTTGAFAPRKMKSILSLFTADEWARGIPFVISLRTSPKTQRNYHDIRVSMEQPIGETGG